MEEVKILKDLISFNTVNPPGDEYLVVNYVKRFFIKNNIKFKIFSKDSKRQNIIGFIGKGKPELLISCHSDTVPAGDGWKTNPFKAVIKNKRIYGRGAIDDKGPLAGLLVAAKEIKKFETNLKGTLLVCVPSDEERGSKFGLKYLIDEKKIKPDFAIMPDNAGSMRRISIAEKGVLWLELNSKGKIAHGSRPEKGINAVSNLIEVLNLIKKYKMKFKEHNLLTKPTINLGQIQGGNAPNMVPSAAKAVLDIRFLPHQDPKQILKEIKLLIEKAKKKNKTININIKILEKCPATEVDRNNKLVNIIKEVTKKTLGFEPGIVGDSGASDAKSLIEKGIPAVGFSLGEGKMFHVANENIKIKELTDFSKVLTEIVKVFLR